eukprot:778546-Amphidinium_carterae.2
MAHLTTARSDLPAPIGDRMPRVVMHSMPTHEDAQPGSQSPDMLEHPQISGECARASACLGYSITRSLHLAARHSH